MRPTRRAILSAVPSAISAPAGAQVLSHLKDGALVREDSMVETSDGVSIFVREVRPSHRSGAPLVLLHGARVPGLASFDLPAPAPSLAADLATATGRSVYVMDARGYGRSARPAAMSEPASQHPPLSRGFEVIRDVHAVVQHARRKAAGSPVALFGWATGGMWAAFYASVQPSNVSHLITLNALYGGSDRHPMLGPGSSTSDPADPSRLSPSIGAYALYDAASLFPGWDRSIPDPDKAAWRDPATTRAYAQAALESDPQSAHHTPPKFRAPLGAMEDSFYQASGRRLFDASSISAHTLVIRSELDFWSRPEDAAAFQHDAVHAASVRALLLERATHFVHLERPERGRDKLIASIVSHLGG